MAQPLQPDPVSLDEVHRLLRDTDFASAAQLAGDVDLRDLGAVLRAERAEREARPTAAAALAGAGGAPLPRRR